jgi:hypothetical protein
MGSAGCFHKSCITYLHKVKYMLTTKSPKQDICSRLIPVHFPAPSQHRACAFPSSVNAWACLVSLTDAWASVKASPRAQTFKTKAHSYPQHSTSSRAHRLSLSLTDNGRHRQPVSPEQREDNFPGAGVSSESQTPELFFLESSL